MEEVHEIIEWFGIMFALIGIIYGLGRIQIVLEDKMSDIVEELKRIREKLDELEEKLREKGGK